MDRAPHRRSDPPAAAPDVHGDRAAAGRRRRIGVALGGGTARGLAHVGALKALEAHDLAPTVVAGTSYGAIVAALYALGTPALALEHLVRQQDTTEIWAQGLDFGLHQASLIHGRRLERWLDRKFFFGATFADTELPLAIACTDLATGDLEVLREGSIAEAVRASCALPGIFAPVLRGDKVLVDGGFVEAVPFAALATLRPSLMIGVHAGIASERSLLIRGLRRAAQSRLGRWGLRAMDAVPIKTPLGRLSRGLALAVRSYLADLRVPEGALLVRVAPPIAWWDFHRSPEAIAAGERAMNEALHAPSWSSSPSTSAAEEP